MNRLYLKNIAGKGRGVFCEDAIEEDALIEACPLIFLKDEDDKLLLRTTILSDYFFYWNDDRSVSVLALGYGSFYNHAVKPNARYIMNYEANIIEIYSLANILPHHEILINYNGSNDPEGMEWFKLRNINYFD